MKDRCKGLRSAALLLGILALTGVFLNKAYAASVTVDLSSESEDKLEQNIEPEKEDKSGQNTGSKKNDDLKQDTDIKQNFNGKLAGVIKKKGKYYAATEDKKVYLPKKEGIKKIGRYKYYVCKNGELATSRVKFKGKNYYFNKKARLHGDIRPIEIDGKYYNVNAKGVMKKISKKHAKVETAAQNFINKHTNKSSSNSEKFRTCFYYMVGNMRYSPNYFKMRADYKILDQKNGGYELALQMFESPVLRGDCHRFANCVAAVAKELGYNPTVIDTKGDHSFVIIDGKYYDNSGALFGAPSRNPYTVYKKIKYT